MKFKKGDYVRVTARDCQHFDHVGSVKVIDGTGFPFGVAGLGSHDGLVWFREHEIILAEAPEQEAAAIDPVNHPQHYVSHPSGVECIQITEHMGFNLGNAIKYVWRADLKGDALEDLRKAIWYIDREIQRREKAK
jgi:hypothetical protein